MQRVRVLRGIVRCCWAVGHRWISDGTGQEANGASSTLRRRDIERAKMRTFGSGGNVRRPGTYL